VGRQPWFAENPAQLLEAMENSGLTVPEDMSEECLDLIMGMLKIEEKNRIPLSKIRVHPWICQGGLLPPPPTHFSRIMPIKEIDYDILKQLKQIGFTDAESEDSISDILNMTKNQIVSTYHLLNNKKKKKKIIERTRRKTKRSVSTIAKKSLSNRESPLITEIQKDETFKSPPSDKRNRSSSINEKEPFIIKKKEKIKSPRVRIKSSRDRAKEVSTNESEDSPNPNIDELDPNLEIYQGGDPEGDEEYKTLTYINSMKTVKILSPLPFMVFPHFKISLI